MIIIQPFRPEHLRSLRIQPAQEGFAAMILDEKYATELAEAGPAFTMMDGDQVIAVAGCVPQHEHRAVAWALLSKADPKTFLRLHRSVARYLAVAPWRRIEMIVDCSFTAGHRWAHALGFHREGTMLAYTPDGRDCDMYARIR